MRVFRIEANERFTEYVQKPFAVGHEEAVLERWLEGNPDGILEDGPLLIIGRQVVTNLGTVIDLLGVDRQGDLVVIELKRDRTPRDTLAQALEYVSFVAQLGTAQLETILRAYLGDDAMDLAEHHRAVFKLDTSEAVAFNKDQRIVIVGQQITAPIRQTAAFLRGKGLRATCVEFSFFQAEGGRRLLTQEIVVGREAGRPQQVAAGSLPVVAPESFLASLDEDGRRVLGRLLTWADERGLPIHWGVKGFSVNADLRGSHVVVFFAYPPGSVFKQSIYTALTAQRGGLGAKTRVPEEIISQLRERARATGLFQPAGREVKCLIDRAFTDEEVERLLAWGAEVVEAAERHGLKE
ncbi:MAG: endonuclease NucS domain-containing protein [Pseudomonadota bacterium]